MFNINKNLQKSGNEKQELLAEEFNCLLEEFKSKPSLKLKRRIVSKGYHLFGAVVYIYALSKTKYRKNITKQEAENRAKQIRNDAFANLFSLSNERFCKIGDFTGYTCKIAHNLAKKSENELSSEINNNFSFESITAPYYEPSVAKEIVQIVLKGKVTDKEYRAFEGWMNGDSYKVISAEINTSRSYAQNLVSKVKKFLKDLPEADKKTIREMLSDA